LEASFDDTDGASGNLRISRVKRYHPAARSSVLQYANVRKTVSQQIIKAVTLNYLPCNCNPVKDENIIRKKCRYKS